MEVEELLIQEQQVLEEPAETVEAAEAVPTMEVTMVVEEILVETLDSTAHGAQVTLPVEMVVGGVPQVVDPVALEET